jgi:hypothetical protein
MAPLVQGTIIFLTYHLCNFIWVVGFHKLFNFNVKYYSHFLFWGSYEEPLFLDLQCSYSLTEKDKLLNVKYE